MTRDPYDRLEDELRRAVSHTVSTPWYLRVPRALVAAMAIVALGGGVATAAALISGDDDRAVTRVLSDAREQTQEEPACGRVAGGHHRTPRLVSGTAPGAVRSDYEIFRRPPRDSDRQPARLLRMGAPLVLRDSVRVARAPDGSRTVLWFSIGLPAVPSRESDPVACLEAQRRKVAGHPDARDPAVRAEADAELARRRARIEALISGASLTLATLDLGRDGRPAGGGATIVRNGKVPAIGSLTTVRRAGKQRLQADGLVPDPVRSVRLIDRDPANGRRAPSHTGRVRDNYFRVLLPAGMGPRFTIQWRAADGEVLRTVRRRR